MSRGGVAMDKETVDNIAAAISNGRTDIVRTLINLCENGNVSHDGLCQEITCDELLNKLCTPSGTLLHFATKLDHMDIVRTLLSAGADPTVRNRMGQTSWDLLQSEKMTAVFVDELLKCAAKSEVERLKQLVAAGVDVNSQDSPENKNTALHWAVCFGRLESVQCLLDLGASPNVLNGQGCTPLHDAVKRKDVDIVKALLAAGGNPEIKCSEGHFAKSPLQIAEDNKEIMSLFRNSLSDAESNGSEHFEASNAPVVNYNADKSVESLSTTSNFVLKQNSCQPIPIPPPLASPLPLITESKLHLLWPQPQYMIQTEGQFFKLKEKYAVNVVKSIEVSIQEIMNAWDVHEEEFNSVGASFDVENIAQPLSQCQGDITCYLNHEFFIRKESYKLIITSEQIRILASDCTALHYALCTLGQLFRLYEGESIPCLFIRDWPQLFHRGVLLDLSLGARNPTIETLKGYVKTMSRLKLNNLHCHFRLELVAEASFPFSNKELITLARYCSRHYIKVVPSLDIDASVTHEQLRACNTSFVIKLMTLLSSNELHVGPYLSKILIDAFIVDGPEGFWSLLSIPSPTMVYLCSDNIMSDIGILQLLPFNIVFVEYSNEVEHVEFDHHSTLLTHSGFNVCICTGTASWGSIAGCPETALTNIKKAAGATLMRGLYGLIVSDWKTTPHHTAFSFSWPGILLALGSRSGTHGRTDGPFRVSRPGTVNCRCCLRAGKA